MKVAKIMPELEKVIKEKEEVHGENHVCDICTLHEVFEDMYGSIVSEDNAVINKAFFGDDCIVTPLCPKCDKPLSPGTSHFGHTVGSVGGSNTVDETEEMQYCQLWHCEECDQDYAMMPTPIVWNANHDIFYTGGVHYLTDDDEKLLLNKIGDRLSESINRFVIRVKNPKDNIDKSLSEWHLNLWMKRGISEAVAEFLREKGFKK